MKILAVDDDPVVLKIVTTGLKALGHKVVACEHGAQAWDAYRQNAFSVVITDWDMPYMDGIELTDRVRKVHRDAYTYIIMLTGMSKREHYLKGLKAGADAFLVKPLDGALLEAQVAIASRILGREAHTNLLALQACQGRRRVGEHGGVHAPALQEPTVARVLPGVLRDACAAGAARPRHLDGGNEGALAQRLRNKQSHTNRCCTGRRRAIA
jgi:DNA-binding response OmpR family regulator